MQKEEKVRTNITFPKSLKTELDKLAKLENRSFNNFVVTVLQNHLDNREEK